MLFSDISINLFEWRIMELNQASFNANIVLLSHYASTIQTAEDVVCDPYGGHLYLATSWQGRALRLFYCVVKWVWNRDLQQDSCIKALVKTAHYFQQLMEQMHVLQRDYLSQIEICALVEHNEQEKIHEIRARIIELHDHLWTLFDPIEKYEGQTTAYKAGQIFQQICPEVEACSTFTMSLSQLKRLNWEWSVCAIESLVEKPFPLKEFNHLIQKIPLDSYGERTLREWVQSIEDNPYITPDLIHRVLDVLIEKCTRCIELGSKHQQLGYLELQLTHRGCSKLKSPDPFCAEWQTELRDNSAIHGDSIAVYSGKEWNQKSLLQMGLRAFYSQSRKDALIITAFNSALLSIYCSFWECQSWAIAPPSPIEIDRGGRILLIHALKDNLTRYPWKSIPFFLHQDDQKMIRVLQHLISYMSEQEYTPSTFDADAIFFDLNEQLISLSLYDCSPFDYSRLDNFIMIVSQKKLSIFQALMKGSTLFDHPISLAYRELQSLILRENPIENMTEWMAEHYISDPQIIQRAQELQKDLIETRNKMVEWMIEEQRVGHAHNEIQVKASELLLQFQEEWGVCSMVWPNIDQIKVWAFSQ